MKNQVSVIIPVHNRISDTRACLRCLEVQTYRHLQIVVVDDGSTDGTREVLREEFPDVVCLQGDGGLWWAGGTNKGVTWALDKGADLIVTLNNDVQVGPDYIKNLVSSHCKHPTALIGSINLTQGQPPRLLYAGIESLNVWTAKCVKRGKILSSWNNDSSGLVSTYSLPGRGTLIPREVFEAVGLFDDVYMKQYASDQDFSLRTKKAGFELLVNLDNPVFSPYEPDRVGGERQTTGAFLKSFFSIRSCNYLPVLARYNFRHHPHKLYFPIFMGLDIGRRFGGFLVGRRRK